MQRLATRCKGTRKDGLPCTSPMAGPSGYCIQHDPARRSALPALRAAGGRARARIARAEKLIPLSLRPLLATLATAVEETHAGTITPSQAVAMASLAGAIVRVFELVELEGRLLDLEQAVNHQHRRTI